MSSTLHFYIPRNEQLLYYDYFATVTVDLSTLLHYSLDIIVEYIIRHTQCYIYTYIILHSLYSFSQYYHDKNYAKFFTATQASLTGSFYFVSYTCMFYTVCEP